MGIGSNHVCFWVNRLAPTLFYLLYFVDMLSRFILQERVRDGRDFMRALILYVDPAGLRQSAIFCFPPVGPPYLPPQTLSTLHTPTPAPPPPSELFINISPPPSVTCISV
jgi:hypothetical protein